jgi:glycosyltransferase involved in cell wall biosynthesis
MAEGPNRSSKDATSHPVGDLISVIVTTYNREDALAAVLGALARQTDRRFEVIVADDGSGPSTRRVVEGFGSRFHRLAHVWHEDEGFRAAEIRNRAILASGGEVCIFLDGDCIPRPNFVAVHRRLAEPGWFVAGNRVLLSPQSTERILREHLEPELWGLPQWLERRLHGEINRLGPLLSLPLGPLRRLAGAAWRSIRSANLAVRRSDLLTVDGFDAAYSGWGREDSDLVVRLMRSGIRRKDGRFATAVLHLWHAENDRSRLPQNDGLLARVRQSDQIKAAVGLCALKQRPEGAAHACRGAQARSPCGR